jgi:hypothetical protein
LAIRIDARIQSLVQSDARTFQHLQNVGANDETGAANDLYGHRSSFTRARGNIEHAMTRSYLSGSEYVWNSEPRPSAKIAVIS